MAIDPQGPSVFSLHILGGEVGWYRADQVVIMWRKSKPLRGLVRSANALGECRSKLTDIKL